VESLRFRNRALAISRGESPRATLLLLHGYGADEYDLMGLAPQLPQSLDLISIRGPGQTPFGGAAWFDIGTTPDGSLVFHEEQALAVAEGLQSLVPALHKAGIIRTESLFLGGFSQGCSIAMLLTALQPEHFRGLLLMSGRMTDSLRETLLLADLAEGFPVFIAHGSEDSVIPLKFGRELRDHWERTGPHSQYREYAMGHEICSRELADINTWFEQLGIG